MRGGGWVRGPNQPARIQSRDAEVLRALLLRFRSACWLAIVFRVHSISMFESENRFRFKFATVF